jgi:hypothetical protein
MEKEFNKSTSRKQVAADAGLDEGPGGTEGVP